MVLPRLGSSKLVSRWIVATVAVSIVAALDGGRLRGALGLEPDLIWHGQLWRLVSWVLVEPTPLGLVLTCASLYSLGGDLAHRWGDRRLRRYALDVLGGAAIVTALLALVFDRVWFHSYASGWAVGDAIVIGWARQYPDRTLRLYGLLELNGRTLVRTTIGITCAYAIYVGPFAMLPELLVCAAAYAYPRARLAR